MFRVPKRFLFNSIGLRSMFCTPLRTFSNKPNTNNPVEREKRIKDLLEGKAKLDLDNPQDLEEAMSYGEFMGQLTKITNRTIISMRGPDVPKFLQNTLTADVTQLDKVDDHRCVYGLFLNPKGRIFTDAFVIKPYLPENKTGELVYWVDIDKQYFELVFKYFQKYSLRKKIDFEHLDDSILSIIALNTSAPAPAIEGHVFKYFQDGIPKIHLDEFPGEEFSDIIMVTDPRNNSLGTRLYTPTEFIPQLFPEEHINNDEDFQPDPSKPNRNPKLKTIYHYTRLINAVAEGTDELKDQLPLNYHMHLLNALNFNKGCYLGHELTQRTFQTGVLRKAVLPFIIRQK